MTYGFSRLQFGLLMCSAHYAVPPRRD